MTEGGSRRTLLRQDYEGQAEDGRQNTKHRRQDTEDRGQRAEDPTTPFGLRRAGRQMLDACRSWPVTRKSIPPDKRRAGNAEGVNFGF
jgi:hypothetical protein